MIFCIQFRAMALVNIESPLGLTPWNKLSSQSRTDCCSDMHLQKLNSALLVTMLSSELSKRTTCDDRSSLTSKSDSYEDDIDHLLTFLTHHASTIIETQNNFCRKADKRLRLNDVKKILHPSIQVSTKKKQHQPDIYHNEALLIAYGEKLLDNHHSVSSYSAPTLNKVPTCNTSCRTSTSATDPPWAIMKRSSRWKTKKKLKSDVH